MPSSTSVLFSLENFVKSQFWWSRELIPWCEGVALSLTCCCLSICVPFRGDGLFFWNIVYALKARTPDCSPWLLAHSMCSVEQEVNEWEAAGLSDFSFSFLCCYDWPLRHYDCSFWGAWWIFICSSDINGIPGAICLCIFFLVVEEEWFQKLAENKFKMILLK